MFGARKAGVKGVEEPAMQLKQETSVQHVLLRALRGVVALEIVEDTIFFGGVHSGHSPVLL